VSVVRSSAIRRSSAWIAFSDLESSAEVASSKIRIRRPFQHGARDRDALLLAARELEAPLADRASHSPRRALDERVDLASSRRGTISSCVAPGRPYAMLYSMLSLKSTVSCGNDPDRRAQARLPHVPYVLAVHGDPPASDVVEAEKAAARACSCPRPKARRPRPSCRPGS
jgi:hypothetical protein